MGILTTQDSAKAFSSYVAIFGLALLITSSMYLKDLNNWAEKHSCVDAVVEDNKEDVLCSNYNTWRSAAIIGIIIGAVDILVVPFLVCCTCCVVCGCAALFCACMKFDSSNESSNQTTTTPTTEYRDEPKAESDEEATANTKADKEIANDTSKFNLENLPTNLGIFLNILGWTLWVLLPLVGTGLITDWIYKTDAIRTRDNQLYKSALTLYVCALLNLLVYAQKFVNSVCEFINKKFCGGKKVEKSSAVSEV